MKSPFFLETGATVSVAFGAFWRSLAPGFRDGLALLAAFAVVSLGLLVWAVWFRRRRSQSYRFEVHRSNGANGSLSRNGHGSGGRQGRRRRKRRRHGQDHHSRNPTLAQTGGLPPAHGSRRSGPAR